MAEKGGDRCGRFDKETKRWEEFLCSGDRKKSMRSSHFPFSHNSFFIKISPRQQSLKLWYLVAKAGNFRFSEESKGRSEKVTSFFSQHCLLWVLNYWPTSRANSARLLAANSDEGILATVDKLAHFEIATPWRAVPTFYKCDLQEKCHRLRCHKLLGR